MHILFQGVQIFYLQLRGADSPKWWLLTHKPIGQIHNSSGYDVETQSKQSFNNKSLTLLSQLNSSWVSWLNFPEIISLINVNHSPIWEKQNQEKILGNFLGH